MEVERQLRLAKFALQLQGTLKPESGASFFRAMREETSKVLEQPVGRIVPVESEKQRERVIKAAQKGGRPLFLAEGPNGKEFILLVDTNKTNKNL